MHIVCSKDQDVLAAAYIRYEEALPVEPPVLEYLATTLGVSLEQLTERCNQRVQR